MLSPAIIEGFVIGVSASIVSAVLLGTLHWVRHLWRRREQLRFVSRLLREALPHLNQMTDLYADDGRKLADGEAVRAVRMKQLINDVQSALRERCQDVSYDHLYAIWNPFDVYYYRLIKDAGHELGEDIYKVIYYKLSRLPFLNVDPWDSV